MDQSLFFIGAVSAFIAVTAGGARAHWLDKRLPAERLPMLEVGMRYQRGHAIGILFCSLAAYVFDSYLPLVAGWVFVAGTLLFSGAMYGFALSGRKPLLRAAPAGGVLFMAGWVCLAVSALI